MPKPCSENSWASFAFGDVVRLSRERSSDPERDGFRRYVGLEHIEPGELTLRRWGDLSEGTTFTAIFRAGQVLFGKRRAYQRKVAVADFDGVCSGDIYVFEAKQERLLPELLPFICQTDGFFEHAVGTSAGSLSPRTNWESLASYEFALPPLDHQRRAALALACIDEYLERCRALELSLNNVLGSMLDVMWSQFSLRKIRAFVDSGVLSPPQDGNHGENHPRASDYVSSGVPFVMSSDLQDGSVDFESCKKIPESVALGLRAGFARHGDVLLSHKGTVGEVARLLDPPSDFVMLTPQVTYYRVLDRGALHPDWLYFSFKSQGFQRLIGQHSKQSTRAYVGITAQQELFVPYCALDEQLQWLRRLWRMEGALITARTRAEDANLVRSRLLREAVPEA